MKKLCFYKSFLPFLIIAMGMIGFSCVDTTTAPELPDLIAEYRIVNAALDAGTISMTVDDGHSVNLDYLAASNFITFDAGSRVGYLSTGDTLRLAMQTYWKGTIVILPKDTSAENRDIIRMTHRRTFDSAVADTGVLRIAHAGLTPATINVTISTTDTSLHFTPVTQELAIGDDSGYLQMPLGTFTLEAVDVADTTATVFTTTSVNVTNVRKTSILMGTTGNFLFVNLNDD